MIEKYLPFIILFIQHSSQPRPVKYRKSTSRGLILSCLAWLTICLPVIVACQSLKPTIPEITRTPFVAEKTPSPSFTSTALATPSPSVTSTQSATFVPSSTPTPTYTPTPWPAIRFAVIGDYGMAGAGEAQVAELVRSWEPDFIITTGDNNYPYGRKGTIDENIGQYFHDFIYPYQGSYGAGAQANRFFPVLGNHDWMTDQAKAYLDYFTLPGNERYYDFVQGPVHFFALDSEDNEPDGVGVSSIQAKWLKQALASATEPWKLVYLHYPPYSSGLHGSISWMQWPFDEWGVNMVMAGHDHDYERLEVRGVFYFVNGLGGVARYEFRDPLTSSLVRYRNSYGAMLVTADGTEMTFKFVDVKNEVIDQFNLRATSP